MSHSPQSFRLSIWLTGELQPSGWSVEIYGQGAELLQLHSTAQCTFDPEEALDYAVAYVTDYIAASRRLEPLWETQPALPFADSTEEGLDGRGGYQGHMGASA